RIASRHFTAEMPRRYCLLPHCRFGACMFRNALRLASGLVLVSCIAVPSVVWAQRSEEDSPTIVRQQIQRVQDGLGFAEESLTKSADDLMLFKRLEDLADVDKVRFTGPPPRVNKNPTAQGAGNPVIVKAYTFLPKKTAATGKLPLIILVHG